MNECVYEVLGVRCHDNVYDYDNEKDGFSLSYQASVFRTAKRDFLSKAFSFNDQIPSGPNAQFFMLDIPFFLGINPPAMLRNKMIL